MVITSKDILENTTVTNRYTVFMYHTLFLEGVSEGVLYVITLLKPRKRDRRLQHRVLVDDPTSTPLPLTHCGVINGVSTSEDNRNNMSRSKVNVHDYSRSSFYPLTLGVLEGLE